MRKTVITISGKAKDVFSIFDLFCQEYGDITLGQMAAGLEWNP